MYNVTCVHNNKYINTGIILIEVNLLNSNRKTEKNLLHRIKKSHLLYECFVFRK